MMCEHITSNVESINFTGSVTATCADCGQEYISRINPLTKKMTRKIVEQGNSSANCEHLEAVKNGEWYQCTNCYQAFYVTMSKNTIQRHIGGN